MDQVKSEFDLNEEKMLFIEVQDEALEAAACSTAGHARAFTLSMCTANLECPF
jgi:hypothetical protein